MKINSIFSIFTPKDKKFFPILTEMATILDNAAGLLQELFEIKDTHRDKELSRLIKEEEVKGDKMGERIFKELNDTFITPFDREDIESLADEMEDAIDAINRSAQKVLLYSPEKKTAASVRLTALIKKGTEIVKQSIIDLSSLKEADKEVREHAKQIKLIEENADTVYEDGIIMLFKEESSIIELIKQKEIIQELENSANSINDIGRVLRTIIIKYA